MRKISIKGKIKTEISKNRFLSYVGGCIKFYKNDDVRDIIRNQSKNTLIIHGKKELYSKQNIYYYVKCGNSFSGFGAQFRRTLEALAFADYYNLIPFVEYTNDFLYAEDGPMNGTQNPFEYYFFQIENAKNFNPDVDLYVEYEEHHRQIINSFFENNMYSISQEYVNYMGYIVKNYIQMNDIVKSYILDSIKRIELNDDYIAVHVRGTDFNMGYKNHPKVISIQNYFSKIDKLLEKDNDIMIFLATDEEKTVQLFKEKYGEKVRIYKDVFRSADRTPVHFSKSSRDNHHYMLGLEILRDIITLSKGKYLIACNSQVSYCARIFKNSRDEKYKEEIIIDEGIYK